MIQRWSLIASFAFTAFVLVVGGAVAGRVMNRDEIVQVTETAPTEPANPLQDPDVLAMLEEREATYQNLIKEANQKLADAYQTQDELTQRLETGEESESITEYPVSPDLAVGLALSVAPNSTTVNSVELVLFQGMPAYEVVLDGGTVYIGAENGWLLHNGAESSEPSGGGSGGYHDDDDHDEHEDGDEDDD